MTLIKNGSSQVWLYIFLIQYSLVDVVNSQGYVVSPCLYLKTKTKTKK